MKKLFAVFYCLLSFLLLYYLALPTRNFPSPPPDSYQSEEPGDSEVLNERRAYFTDFDREEVIGQYKDQFSYLPILRLNYPPEEAQTLIRDQTRSTFLEEIVHPLRESIYINGFKPRVAKDEIWYKGVHYEQKITIRYQTSSLFTRILIYSALIFTIPFIFREYLLLAGQVKLKTDEFRKKS